jgi:hypothetical protein
MYGLFSGIGGMMSPFGMGMNPMMSQIGMMALMAEQQRRQRESANQDQSINESVQADANAALSNAQMDQFNQVNQMKAGQPNQMKVSGVLNMNPMTGQPQEAQPTVQPLNTTQPLNTIQPFGGLGSLLR